VAVTVSGACLYYATRGADWAAVGRSLAAADLWWVAVVSLASIGCHAVRAERWRVLLRPVTRAPFGPAFSATLVGFGANMALPLRAGEILRPTLLARRIGIGVTPAFASIVVERLLDMLLVVTCFVAATFVYPAFAAYRALALGLAGGGAVGQGMLAAMVRRRVQADALLGAVTGRLPGRVARIVEPIAHGILDGARALGDPGTMTVVVLSSVLLWTLIVLTYLLSFLALDLQVPLVAASLTTMVVVAAFAFLPQLPGFLGTWQTACVLALHEFGVDEDHAITYAFLTWIVQMVVNVGAGAIAAWMQDLTWRQLVGTSMRGGTAPERESA
jgi:hypothetical protein